MDANILPLTSLDRIFYRHKFHNQHRINNIQASIRINNLPITPWIESFKKQGGGGYPGQEYTGRSSLSTQRNVGASLKMGASRLRRDCLRQRGMSGCGHP